MPQQGACYLRAPEGPAAHWVYRFRIEAAAAGLLAADLNRLTETTCARRNLWESASRC